MSWVEAHLLLRADAPEAPLIGLEVPPLTCRAVQRRVMLHDVQQLHAGIDAIFRVAHHHRLATAELLQQISG